MPILREKETESSDNIFNFLRTSSIENHINSTDVTIYCYDGMVNTHKENNP